MDSALHFGARAALPSPEERPAGGRMLKIDTLVCSLAFSCQALAVGPSSAPPALTQITARFKTSMLECPERIWNDFSWQGLQVIFVSKNDAQAWLWDASSDAFRQVPVGQLPSSARDALYQFFKFEGKPAMSLSTTSSFPVDLFELGVHEFFHNQGQASWQSPAGAGGRGTVYPVRWEPRLYRRMIFDHLKAYVGNAQDSELAYAKYWFEKWKTEFPAEALSTADGYEGSADYVEKMAGAIAKHGCSATDSILRQELVAMIANSGHSVSGRAFALDSEGYEIGGLATIALRFRQGDPRSWAPRFAQGLTGLEILLENISPVPEKAPDEILATFQKAEGQINREYGALLDTDIANWLRKDHVRVALNFSWLQSNLMPRFFATSESLSLQLYPLAAEHRFLAPDGTSDYRFRANAVVFGHFAPICPKLYGYVLVPASSLHTQNGTVTLASPRAAGRIQGKIHTDAEGFQYLCAE